jgi:hypothetical protein
MMIRQQTKIRSAPNTILVDRDVVALIHAPAGVGA